MVCRGTSDGTCLYPRVCVCVSAEEGGMEVADRAKTEIIGSTSKQILLNRALIKHFRESSL